MFKYTTTINPSNVVLENNGKNIKYIYYDSNIPHNLHIKLKQQNFAFNKGHVPLEESSIKYYNDQLVGIISKKYDLTYKEQPFFAKFQQYDDVITAKITKINYNNIHYKTSNCDYKSLCKFLYKTDGEFKGTYIIKPRIKIMDDEFTILYYIVNCELIHKIASSNIDTVTYLIKKPIYLHQVEI